MNAPSDEADNADNASLQYALIDLRVALREFSSCIGTSPTSYVREIYHRWWDTRSSETTLIAAAVRHINGLLSTASRSHSIILQIDGVGDHLAEADSALARFREVVCLLEDILCSTLISRKEAEKMYKHKGFLFQFP